ncbi:hypothetical protein SAMN05421837_103789 [Amycolatopsis pretoriensis]|uniref:Protein RecA n=1 Tax=Amycolatopsis pretoriensis TaxID=218821 RepID=A0A1H5QMK2_9PSEU|nr:hypothetical protein [Amycolatopsis pretoriensis]SEF27382.1 hypothetical protein SAMN05421837_103789 [Amycolatopsis pretoriensis]
MAVPEAVAGLAAIPGVRTASQLKQPGLETPAAAGSLPVVPVLAELLPGGELRRGSTVSVSGSTALVLGLLAEATQQGSWAAVAGMPELGVTAAAELGVDLDRFALVPEPGAELVAVVSALIDGFDLVVLGPAAARGVQPQLGRRLAGRVRNRGAVLLAMGVWPGADLELRVSNRKWRGLTEDGFGHLKYRDVVVSSRGRGAAARPHTVALQLPGPGGAAAAGSLPARSGLSEVAG